MEARFKHVLVRTTTFPCNKKETKGRPCVCGSFLGKAFLKKKIFSIKIISFCHRRRTTSAYCVLEQLPITDWVKGDFDFNSCRWGGTLDRQSQLCVKGNKAIRWLFDEVPISNMLGKRRETKFLTRLPSYLLQVPVCTSKPQAVLNASNSPFLMIVLGMAKFFG